MAPMFKLILVILFEIGSALSPPLPLQWMRSAKSSSLMSNFRSGFIGYFDGSIFILGGWFVPTLLHEYDITIDSFVPHTNAIDFGDQYGQSSTQINNILYMLPRMRSSITAFNLPTLSISDTIAFPGTAAAFRCMTHYYPYLLITGGDNLAEFHIYNTLNSAWSTGTSMPLGRGRHACSVVQQTLFVMGGTSPSGTRDDIISLDFSTNFQGQWTTFNGLLHTAKYEHRAVAWQNIIYSIGGLGADKDVDIIDSIAETATLDSTMLYTKRYVAAVVVDSIVYVFGGTPTTNNQYFQYALIPTVSPTVSPTNPTNIPSVLPTNPTFMPSFSPTSRTFPPTNAPTLPTIIPTRSPTNPTYKPTFIPTSSPILSPTEWTSPPSLTPTTAIPSRSPTDPFSIEKYLTMRNIIISSVGILVLVICLIILVYYIAKICLVRKYKIAMSVNKAMVIIIAIGQYDDDVTGCDEDLKGAHLANLNEIDKDISNLSKLFGVDNLNYRIYPNPEEIKVHWTEQEIVSFLNRKAVELNKAVEENEFDALVVAISCHGYNNNICTSDYKLISKVAIHRIFTTNYTSARLIPRVFLFDCCDGNDQRDVRRESDDEDEVDVDFEHGKAAGHDDGNVFEHGKSFAVDDIQRGDVIWSVGEKNPDHKLVVANAANAGFQSKLNTDTGSYMLYEFVKKTLDQLKNSENEGKCIYETFDEIQQDLAERGKQQIIVTYNDKTRYIKFNKNTKKLREIEVVSFAKYIGERKDYEMDEQNGNVKANHSLTQFLTFYKLTTYESKLIECGAETLNDLEQLDEADIGVLCVETRMKLLHKRKFVKACKDLKDGKYHEK